MSRRSTRGGKGRSGNGGGGGSGSGGADALCDPGAASGGWRVLLWTVSVPVSELLAVPACTVLLGDGPIGMSEGGTPCGGSRCGCACRELFPDAVCRGRCRGGRVARECR